MSSLAALFATISLSYGIPDGLLSAMCFTESSHKITVVRLNDGGEDSLGVCQIKLSTAKYVGFKGTRKDLMKPKNNIESAAKYLQYNYKRYGNWSRAVIAYNKGSSTGPMQNKYWCKVMKHWGDDR